MADDDGMGLRVVASNTDRDVRIDWARRQMAWPLRELTANLLRITRGAGKPHMLIHQITDVTAAFQEYWNAAGYWPSACEIHQVLNIGADRPVDFELSDWASGIETMASGAMQYVASKLVHQVPQKAAGESEMIRGLVEIERIRAMNWADAQDRTRIVPFSERNSLGKKKQSQKRPTPKKPKA